jgi:hypothetical protein
MLHAALRGATQRTATSARQNYGTVSRPIKPPICNSHAVFGGVRPIDWKASSDHDPATPTLDDGKVTSSGKTGSTSDAQVQVDLDSRPCRLLRLPVVNAPS